MKLKIKALLLFFILILSMNLVGCKSSLLSINSKHSDMEKIVIAILDDNELISIKEEKTKIKVNNKEQKNLTITLNLPHSSKTVALDNAMSTATKIIYVLEETFKDVIHDYKFVINTNVLDIYGNKQKVKILEIAIDDIEVDKINFENFDYKNLKDISKIKKFNYLNDEDSTISNDNTI